MSTEIVPNEDLNFKLIEINGVKMQIDLRTAKKIEEYRVGDSVKVLVRRYSDSWESYPGVIVGFAEFKNLPSIELLIMRHNGDLEFKVINAKTEDIEIAPFNRYETSFSYITILETINNKIATAEAELCGLKSRKEAFVQYFGKLLPED